ncbi:Probable M18 family aminopeptidase 1 [Slackia heliotrinireducens]|uniref:M18 family aminopeptidase n=1 Tax=Slackia heliotrinireducens (strain ATCC 29202 / DSM 20476 / NCTC 11029 / RHS 1) TaxID=471855 RepID=C7N3Z1_SLAHD|nr:aminopeptidase [Slackia heliotrinireducens]ACV21732.1 aspartyl aminopeptidase [Slackia heliotrinireducens DSM 20476]VEG99379.1 Probable M18 family aminopeptidase 1 [Slackia heliotrinireducens]
MERKNAWKDYTAEDRAAVEAFAEDYRGWISANKTERECAKSAIAMAREAGYISLEEARAAGMTLKAGDRVYADAYGKTLLLAHIGSRPLEDGLNILGAHIDSPRLDIKQNPVYESTDYALLDTHYYGGVKKYQWVTLPLALHGVVVKKDGSAVEVNVGEDPADPVFCVTDLLIHLAQEQMQKKATEVVTGEDLDLLVGGRPAVKDEIEDEDLAKLVEKEPVKAMLLKLLADKYQMCEEDFLSSELEVVPAGPARDLGFDRSMILGYGHDDRSCSYPSLIAQLEAENLEKTGVCLLVDKEEIGSVGATGITSMFFENTMAEILDLCGQLTDLSLRRCLANSSMLSSDVSAGLDPLYASAFETKNSAYLGRGIVFNKFTGSRGKSGSNDANAEYMAKIRDIMDKGGASYQTAELGRVDLGGGGTIAYILAKYGMNVIDAGVPVLSMHAPWEVVSKADLYEALKAYRAFLKLA